MSRPEDKQEIFDKFAAKDPLIIDPNTFALTYDVWDMFDNDPGNVKMKELLKLYLGTSGSPIVSGNLSGHCFNLRGDHYNWRIMEYKTWTGYVSKLLVPLKIT